MKKFTLKTLSEMLEVPFQGDPGVEVLGVGILEEATCNDITFLVNQKYQKFLADSQAGVVILSPSDVEFCQTNMLISDDPYYTYAQVTALFAPVFVASGVVDASATVADSAVLENNISVGPNAVIGEKVHCAEGVVIGANVVVESGARLGKGTVVHANAVIYPNTVIGAHCEIASGAILGSEGFGNAMHQGRWHKVHQLGRVVVHDHVSIGCNTCIDRGAIGDTIIGEGVKLDNLIQVGHNVKIGDHTAIAGCVGIAGSTTIGKYCQIGGGSGITGHITISDYVGIAGKSMISKSINEPGHYTNRGFGQQNLQEYQKTAARIRRLEKLECRLKLLEAQLNK